MELRSRQVVAVLWNDAHYNTDEVDTADITHRPWQYVTVGILIRSDAIGVSLATDLGEDGKWRGRNFVPRAMVADEWVVGAVSSRRRTGRAARTAAGADATAAGGPAA